MNNDLSAGTSRKYKLIGIFRLFLLWLTLSFSLLLFGLFGLTYLYIKSFNFTGKSVVSERNFSKGGAELSDITLQAPNNSLIKAAYQNYNTDIPSDLSRKGEEVFQAQFIKKVAETLNKYFLNIRKGLFLFVCALFLMVLITVNRTVSAVTGTCRNNIIKYLESGKTTGSVRRKFTALMSVTGLLSVGTVCAVLCCVVQYANLHLNNMHLEYDGKDIFILYTVILILGFFAVALSAYIYAGSTIKKYQYERQNR